MDDIKTQQEIRAFLERATREFRAETEAEGDGAAKTAASKHSIAMAKKWQRKVYDEGWAGITIPKAYGGRGETISTQIIYNKEAKNFDFPNLTYLFVGLHLVSSTLVDHGTDAQKDEFIRRTLNGDLVWCQLFSEPGAGSDLAGLSTRAVRDGDIWKISGQKVWSSGAHIADYGILLTRSDRNAAKHRGITAFLLDMKTPGITVRPLRMMTGETGFNEVFFDEVEISDSMRLGEVNAGWGVAMTALGHERIGLMGARSVDITGLIDLARETYAGRDVPGFVRQGIASLYARSLAVNSIGEEVADMVAEGANPTAYASSGKLTLGYLLNEAADLAMQIEGYPGGALAQVDAIENGRWQHALLEAPARRIAGGSDEVQRSVIAERVLKFPRSRGH